MKNPFNFWLFPQDTTLILTSENKEKLFQDLYKRKLSCKNSEGEASDLQKWLERQKKLIVDTLASDESYRENMRFIKPTGIMQNRDYSYICSFPDFLLESPESGDQHVCFVVFTRYGLDWGVDKYGKIPFDEYAMAQHYLLSFPAAKTCKIFTLIGGLDFRDYEIYPDKTVQGTIVDLGKQFFEFCMQLEQSKLQGITK